MTYRKTWFSYVLWAVFAGICVSLLTFMGDYLLLSAGVSDAGSMAGALLCFPVAAAVYPALRTAVRAVRKKYTMHAHTTLMWEWFIVVLIFTVSILYHIYMAANCIAIYNGSGSETLLSGLDYNTVYFQNAVIGAGGSADPVTNEAGQMYVLCLSFVMSFLGNKTAAAVVFQLVLYTISLVLCYVIVRKAAGRFTACIVLLLFSLLGYGEALRRIDPGCFIFTLYLACLLAVVNFVKAYCAGRMKRPIQMTTAVITGIMIGIMIYLDFKSVTLFVFLIGIFTGKKQDTGRAKKISAGINAMTYFVILLCAAAAWFLTDCALYQNGGLWYSAVEWFRFNIVSGNYGQIFYFLGRFDSLDTILPIFMTVGMASFLVFAFPKSGREQNYMLWILACLIAAPTPFTGNGVVMYRPVPLFFWSVLAGLGLQNCIFGEKVKLMQEVIEQINAAAEPIGEVKREPEKQEPEKQEPEKQEPEKQEPEKHEPEKKEKPRFIENPLPLPKRHVKKEMDYQYEVTDDKMKYDIEVDENDDFDIL